MKFNAPKPQFGKRPQADAFPDPLISKAKARRTAQIDEASTILDMLPGPGETLHVLQTGRFDLCQLLVVLIGKLGGCAEARIATLAFSRANLADLLELLDSRAVGKVTLLASSFFKANNKELWSEADAEFRERGQRAGARRSHAKVVCLTAIDGRKYSLEGSANLRSNGNVEQFALTQDATIHDWHAAWIDAIVAQHEEAAQ